MNHRTSTDAQPWWADVEHLQGRVAEQVEAPVIERSHRSELERASAARRRSRPAASPRARRASGQSGDWFVQEAHAAGRRTSQAPDASRPARPARPRATLIDDTTALLHRPIPVRRNAGERPTVTITGRPDAALPPRVAPPAPVRGRRTREQATALVASPDRLILWAVALGILMILASIGTASV